VKGTNKMEKISITTTGNYDIHFANELKKYDGWSATKTTEPLEIKADEVKHLMAKYNEKLAHWIESESDTIISKYENKLKLLLEKIQEYNFADDEYAQLNYERSMLKANEDLLSLIEKINSEIQEHLEKEKANKIERKRVLDEMQNQYSKKVLPLIKKLETELSKINDIGTSNPQGSDATYITKAEDMFGVIKHFRELKHQTNY